MMHPQEDRTQRTLEINHRVPSEAFRIEKVGAWQNAGDNFPMSVSANQGDQGAELPSTPTKRKRTLGIRVKISRPRHPFRSRLELSNFHEIFNNVAQND